MRNLLLPALFLLVNSMFIVCCSKNQKKDIYYPQMRFTLHERHDGTFEALGETYKKYEPHTDYSVMVYPVSVPKYSDIRDGDIILLERDQGADEFFSCFWGSSKTETYVRGKISAVPPNEDE